MKDRPTSVTVFAIINFVWAGLGVVVEAFTPEPMGDSFGDSNTQSTTGGNLL